MSKKNAAAAPVLGATTPTTAAVQPGAIESKAAEPIINAILRLEIAQSLPEVPADADLEPVEHAEGAIELFVASETDRRTMRIVGFNGGLAAQHAPDAEPKQE